MNFDNINRNETLFFDTIKERSVLWVLHADKIPPHIGISTSDSFFSLKSNGKDNGVTIALLRKILDAKKVPSLCLVLKDNIDGKVLQTEFEKYKHTIPNEISCLTPIKNILKIASAKSLHGLLNSLGESKQIDAVFGLNLPLSFSQIQDYNEIDINNRLISLALKKQGLSLIPMSESHVDLVLQIENDPQLWEVSNNDANYSREDIVNLELLLRDVKTAKQARWMISYGTALIGTVDLFDIDFTKSTAGVGIYVQKEFRLKNLALGALKLVEIEARKIQITRLEANVQSSNLASLSLFKKSHYTVLETDENISSDSCNRIIKLERCLKS